MQLHRFYAPPSQVTDSRITLDADEAHHLTRVLRLGAGDRVWVFDGEGVEWECQVELAGKRQVELKILNRLADPVESPLQLTLAQALIKSDKFDWVVQKCTELGVTRIVPLLTERSEIRRAEERAERMRQRWARIALESLKQCRRRRLVEIAEPLRFDEFCRNQAEDHMLIFSEYGGRSLREIGASLTAVSRLNLCVGPEGGWSREELQLADQYRAIPVHLGSRILRTETAAVAAVTLAQHLFGDMK